MPAQPPRIVVSDTVHSPDSQRGVARYFSKMLAALVTTYGARVILCSPRRVPAGPSRPIRTWWLPGRYRLNRWLQGMFATAVAQVAGATVYYSPYYGYGLTSAKEVFTVYDMTYERERQRLSVGDRLVAQFIAEKRRCLQRAHLLLPISQSARDDVRACYPHLRARLEVVPPGIDDVFFEPARRATGAPPYLLFVGQRAGYKNFMHLLGAYGEHGLASRVELVVISPTGSVWTDSESAYLQEHQLTGKVRLVHSPPDNELRDYYHGAVALVYPSVSEGFGLPIVEAMASGTLVATSATTAMPEVGGEAALYFDPNNLQSIAECMWEVVRLSDVERRLKLEAGHRWAQRFRWPRRQQAFLTHFQQALSG